MHAVLVPGKLNICHGNAQSLCAKKGTKLDEIRNNLQDSKITIACFTESWLTTKNTDRSIAIPGFSFLRNDRKYGRGGGIVIYFKEHLGCKEVFRIEPSEETVDKTECLACELRFDTEKVLLLVVYNPPAKSPSRTLIARSHFGSLDFDVSPPARSTYRDYVNFNADDVENGIRSVAWNEFYNFRNPNEMLDFFNSHVKRIHDQCIPLRTCSNRKKFNPWFNNDIKRSILERDMAYDDLAKGSARP
ncbi:hypothetical protein quinque_006144 [Culex quinquefasciatus]